MDYSMKPSPDTPEPVDDEEDEMTLDPERSYSNRAASRKFGHHLSNSTGDLNIPPGGASSYPQLMHTFDMLPSYTRGILPAPAHQPAPPPPPPPLHDFRSAGYHHPHHHPHPNQHHAHQHPLNNTAPARRSGEYLPSYIGGGVRLNGGGTATDHLPIDGRLHGVGAPSGGGPTCGGGGDSYSSVLGGDLMTNNMTGGGALGLTSLHLVPPPPQSLSSRESSRCSDSPSDEPRSSPTSSSGGLTEQTQGLAIQDDSVHTSTQLKTRPKPISKNDKSKTCLVCGDHALGYNFNAITCESCKAFFRRNAYKNIRGRCEGTCVVTIETRSYCKRCRLAKCFAVGMRKDLILNDEQKKLRRAKIETNRQRKKGLLQPATSEPATSESATSESATSERESPGLTLEGLVLPSFSSLEDEMQDCKANDMYQTLQYSPPTDVPVHNTAGHSSTASGVHGIGMYSTVHNIVQQNTAANVQFGVHTGVQNNVQYNLAARTSTNVQSPTQNNKVMKQEEPVYTHCIAEEVDERKLRGLCRPARLMIQEMIEAFRNTFDLPPDRETISNPASNNDYLNMADPSAKRCIGMVQGLRLFQDLQDGDKRSLLKGSMLEVLILRSVKLYDCRVQGWKNSVGEKVSIVSAEGMQKNRQSCEYMTQYQRFATRFMSTIRGDPVILMLVMVITIFCPDREGITCRAQISEAQDNYTTALDEYITLNYPEDRTMFAKVLQELTDIRELDESHSNVMVHVNADTIEPLIVKIFKLSASD